MTIISPEELKIPIPLKINKLINTFIQKSDEDLLGLEKIPEMVGLPAEDEFVEHVFNGIRLVGTELTPSTLEEAKHDIHQNVDLKVMSLDGKQIIKDIEFKIFYLADKAIKYTIQREGDEIFVYEQPEGHNLPDTCSHIRIRKKDDKTDEYFVVNSVFYDVKEARYKGTRYYNEDLSASLYL